MPQLHAKEMRCIVIHLRFALIKLHDADDVPLLRKIERIDLAHGDTAQAELTFKLDALRIVLRPS